MVAAGCTTCGPGQTLGFELHVSNPGAAMLVELKTGARLPDGAVVTILGRHEEELLPSGVMDEGPSSAGTCLYQP